jgi:diguanylate cyclase (GGDEF)-like protein
MLSLSTLWIVFVANFLALGAIWAYVARTHPSFGAARLWSASTFIAAVGAALSILRSFIDPHSWMLYSLVLSIGGTLLTFACCLSAAGVQRYYDRAVWWRSIVMITVLNFVCLAWFATTSADLSPLIVINSIGQSLPLALVLPLLFGASQNRHRSGGWFAGFFAVLMVCAYVVRIAGAALRIGGEVRPVDYNAFQAILVMALVFLSLSMSFGFLVMAIDRLRAEMAALALRDELTGVANRRHLLQRLAEACAQAHRGGEVFALLAIDLDGFKAINDNRGHAVGDEYLRRFSQVVQNCLRSSDFLARMGGDEFCVLLPATTWREGAMIARRVLRACEQHGANDGAMGFSASIGVAQWREGIGLDGERLIAAADRALYAVKNAGKNGYLVDQEGRPEAPAFELHTLGAAS